MNKATNLIGRLDIPMRVRSITTKHRAWMWVLAAVVLTTAATLSYAAPTRGVMLVLGASVGVVLLQHPRWGLFAIVPAALVMPIEVGTGTEVAVNPATVFVPITLAVWSVDMLRRGEYEISWSRVNLPLALFLLAGLLSLLIGAVTWNPAVPRSWRFVVVQLAQWSIFAFSAFAFWLTANLLGGEAELRGLSFLYLSLATALAVLRVMPGGAGLAWRFATHAIDRAPFWALLVAVAGGQLLFNRTLAVGWRLISIVALLSALVYAFVLERDTASNWIGVATVLGALVWLRWPTLRWVAMIVVVVLTLNGFLYSAVYDFAGGDEEWRRSGGSRLALIMRVIDVTMRNPVTGLGPAAYRPYSRVKPLSYGGALYATPNVSSHNNYVDLFSHVGLLGLGLFVWLAVEVTSLAFRLRTRYAAGFAAGYVNGMLAAWAGALVLMVLADWILPFVYNIGFRGFQASLLIWLFLGGLGLLEKEVST